METALMIESRYRKEDLARIAKTIARVPNPRRWSERSHCVVERDLMIGFFMLRRLIELKKVSTAISDRWLTVYSYESLGKPVTQMNSSSIDKLYDVENEVEECKRPTYIANQFVHAYTSFVFRDETRNWSDVLIVSDYDRNNCIWRVPVPTIYELFVAASTDYPQSIRYTFDSKKCDYIMSVD